MKSYYIDIETYCELDLKKVGLYKYASHKSFEILFVAVKQDRQPIQVMSLNDFKAHYNLYMRLDDDVLIYAHNSMFERVCFDAVGLSIPIEMWRCSMVKAAYCGLPLGLDAAANALDLDVTKDKQGKALINYFCSPCKPTKANGYRTRNTVHTDYAKFMGFIRYCIQDVEVMYRLLAKLQDIKVPTNEQKAYILDQQINDRGVTVDLNFVQKAHDLNIEHEKDIQLQIEKLTNVTNGNSAAQIKKWLESETGEKVTSLNKETVQAMKDTLPSANVERLLSLRQQTGNTANKKYAAMLESASKNGQICGLFQFYGAFRTGRWAGRLVQLQNLPRTTLSDAQITIERGLVARYDYETLTNCIDLGAILGQLIRTAIVAKPQKTLCVVDFSAIEARVLAWVAGEKWRLDVFKTHGKIYEASASAMFGVPIESVTKGSELRLKGKISELALGYGGGSNAMLKMGALKMGLHETELNGLVRTWRNANKAIVNFWYAIEKAAIETVLGDETSFVSTLAFHIHDGNLIIELPSQRTLIYRDVEIRNGQLTYMGQNAVSGQWERIETYGGKLTENIVQAIARDLLVSSMLRLDAHGFEITMHVHDEIVCEVPKTNGESALSQIVNIVSVAPNWAKDLPLTADGYISDFYKKD